MMQSNWRLTALRPGSSYSAWDPQVTQPFCDPAEPPQKETERKKELNTNKHFI